MEMNGIELQFIVEDRANPEKPHIWPEHGLAILIKAKIDKETINILFDTGTSGKALLHNAREMNLDLRKVDVIVLSHGHYDHTGGLLDALKAVGKPTAIIVHPDALEMKFATKPKFRFTGIPYTISDVEGNGGKILVSKNPVSIAENIIVTGEIERTTEYEKTPDYYMIAKNGEISRDKMLDDQALIIDHGDKGLVVVTGCAHAGIINTVKHAKKITGRDKIYAVTGGFHLINASDERIEKTIRSLRELGPEVIAPCHCTGDNALKKMKKAFEGRFIEINAGSILKL